MVTEWALSGSRQSWLNGIFYRDAIFPTRIKASGTDALFARRVLGLRLALYHEKQPRQKKQNGLHINLLTNSRVVRTTMGIATL